MENHNSNFNNNNANAFWDFVRSFDPNGNQRPGAGIDHANSGPHGFQFPEGFPFHPSAFGPAGGPWWSGNRGRHWGRHGRGRHWHGYHDHHRHHDSGDEDTPPEDDAPPDTETMRDSPEDGNAEKAGDPAPPQDGGPRRRRNHSHHRRGSPPPFEHPHPPPFDHHMFGPHAGGPGPHRRRGGRFGRGGRHGGMPPYEGAFDFRPLMSALSSHPFAQTMRDYAEQMRNGSGGDANRSAEQQNDDNNDAFTPPVDTFETEKTYVLHVALPGASKEDIGVSWDGEKVNIAGVVYRPGNEEFLRCLSTSERKVGMFQRSIRLPPAGSPDTDDVDGYSMSAKMENGILIVTVPKIEKDNTWTEIHKVDIE
ncbi:HSP20-like chaperone [Xylariaceae sp. FL0255]|nr:HSP20-like chaperone [Xylariaceae sp. FL0255]